MRLIANYHTPLVAWKKYSTFLAVSELSVNATQHYLLLIYTNTYYTGAILYRFAGLLQTPYDFNQLCWAKLIFKRTLLCSHNISN